MTLRIAGGGWHALSIPLHPGEPGHPRLPGRTGQPFDVGGALRPVRQQHVGGATFEHECIEGWRHRASEQRPAMGAARQPVARLPSAGRHHLLQTLADCHMRAQDDVLAATARVQQDETQRVAPWWYQTSSTLSLWNSEWLRGPAGGSQYRPSMLLQPAPR